MNFFKALASQTEVAPGLVPAEESSDEVIEGEEFERKRQVAEISRERHLEEREPCGVGDPVDPFRIGEEIPHLPEETADECTQPEGDHRPPVTPGQVVALYDGDRLLGGGTIARALRPNEASRGPNQGPDL